MQGASLPFYRYQRSNAEVMSERGEWARTRSLCVELGGDIPPQSSAKEEKTPNIDQFGKWDFFHGKF